MSVSETLVTADLQLLELPSHVVHRLSQLLTPLEGWKQLMQVIVQPGCLSKLLFSTEHVDLVREESRRSGRSETELVLDEWSTWGRRQERPRVSHLLHALTTCGLLRAADYISDSLLHLGRAPRPHVTPNDGIIAAPPAADISSVITASSAANITTTNHCADGRAVDSLVSAISESREIDAVRRDVSVVGANSDAFCDAVRRDAAAGTNSGTCCDLETLRVDSESSSRPVLVGGDNEDDGGSEDPSCLHFSYSYLCQITGDFGACLAVRGEESEVVVPGRRLGGGAFGSVFYASSDLEGQLAVKHIADAADLAAQQFRTEVEILSSYRHVNLLPLVGFSCDGDYNCLVYAYMSNGSLYDRLACKSGTAPLSWPVRVRVARDTAAALHYLHTHPLRPLIHRDIKSANILLDEHWRAKVGDFGLARQSVWGRGAEAGSTAAVRTQLTQTVLGTAAYMAPEAFRGDISVKMDVFSFGVVMLEILTGLPPFDENREGCDLLSHVHDVVLVDVPVDITSSHSIDETTLLALASCGIADKRASPDVDCRVYTILPLALRCTDDKRRRINISVAFNILSELCEELGVQSVC